MSTARVLAEQLIEPALDENTVITELWLEFVSVRQEAADAGASTDIAREEL